ncbi:MULTISPECIES: ATP-grasp domain-containing protein [unclassified Carboxylicivirga]|uniref:carboxylate--amine ligase n=1 Tax=Carboxylicivirga TaxID=1628153 RepID=UPI003D34B356
MRKPHLNILILDAGRQALPFLKSYAKAGHHITVVCNTRLNECYFSRYPNRKLLWPNYVNQRDEFEQKLFEYLENNTVDVTISVGDISSDILSKNKSRIEKFTHITSPEYETFLQGADKLKLMKYCMANHLPCPKTFELDESILGKLESLIGFPVIIKPLRGVGAVGVKRYNNIHTLTQEYSSLKQEFGSLLVQEYIPQEGGVQYQAEAFLDERHMLRACLVILKPRFFPVTGGTSTANVTVEHTEIHEITKQLLEGLKWQGPADVDYIFDPRDNTPKILEINPRVTAGIKIGFVAGIDFADLHLNLALKEEVPLIRDYRKDVLCRNVFLEILWFLFSTWEMKHNMQPSLLRLYGKNSVDQLFSWDDPFTGLGFFLHMIKKYLSFKNFKAKFLK